MLGENIRVSTQQFDSADSQDDAQRPLPQITQKQAKRLNTPIRGMIISTVVLVLITLPIYWLMPQPNKNPYRPSVDVPVVAYESSQQAGYPVVSPELEGWHYNFARWNTGNSDGIDYWQTGQVTPSEHYIETTQAKDTNATWVSNMVDNAPVSGETEVAGVTWEVRSLTNKDKQITLSYVGEVEGTTVIVSGEADAAEIEQLAEATVAYAKKPVHTEAPTADPSSGIK